MPPLKEAQVGVHAADHGLQELISLAAFQLSHLAGAVKPGILGCCLQATCSVSFAVRPDSAKDWWVLKVSFVS